jgi:hypothetical protein
MVEIQGNNGAVGWPMACVNIDDLLNSVNAEIIQYEARQLAKFKSELETFHKKKDGVVRSYNEKYAELREKWCRQNSEVELLHRNLRHIFKGRWKEYIQKCVCPPLSDVATTETKIFEAQTKCRSALELTRDSSKIAADAAKLYLDTITANQSKLEAALSTNEKWIGQIKQLLQGKEAALSIYIFWFKLLPAHASMAPSDLEHCLEFAKGQSPTELCPRGQSGAGGPQEQKPAPIPHPVPWLVAPTSYANEIDCAWTLYRDAKQAHSDADAAYQKAVDSVVSLEKLLDALRKDLDLKVQDCLNKLPVMDDCGCGGEVANPPKGEGEAGLLQKPLEGAGQAGEPPEPHQGEAGEGRQPEQNPHQMA